LTTWSIELLCAVAVTLGFTNLGLLLLRFFWQPQVMGLDRALFGKLPLLRQVVAAINRWPGSGVIRSFSDLLPALGWPVLARLLALLVGNAFRGMRTTGRGMLVEFAGGWLPIRWDTLKSIKVTEDLAAERFVLLAQTDERALTGWHRCYSMFYNF